MYLFNLLAEEFRGAPDIFWGIFTFVLGLIIVFAGMAILVLVVSLVAKAMTAKSKKKAADENEDAADEIEAVTATEPAEEGGIPENVRVAIMAAVLAYYEGEGVKNEFVVKKIKKLNY